MRTGKVERILQDPQGTSDSDDETDEESWQVGFVTCLNSDVCSGGTRSLGAPNNLG